MTMTGKFIQTAPIEIPADVTALEGMRVQYRHYNTFADLMTGTIEQAKVTKFGIEVYICPDKESSSLPLLSKWRNLANDSVVRIVEDEPPCDEEPIREWNEPGYIGDGFTNEYDYDHPVHGNALADDDYRDTPAAYDDDAFNPELWREVDEDGKNL